MKRRDFLLAASGVAGGTAAAAAPAGAQQTTTSGGGNQSGGNGTGGNQTTGSAGGNQSSGNQSSGNQSKGGGGGGGATKTVKVGPGGELVFEPAELQISPGTTVKWVWESNTHNVVPESQPDGAGWKGSGSESETFDSGHTYEHTFDTEGSYEYFCAPHKSAGMTGSIQVGGSSGGGGAPAEVDPEDMGVPFQAHYVGIATILMMVVSLIYTFFFLKYGESAHSSGGNR
ncbi:plastocyanin/azurin family copper-binding protein [Haladaptatus caseinilyticus]|uniref:plastocyanin/azurin family copper-binding protein n=1 Tax=Haladaptatus caseinilyticus TaxID=2993314 RepID=UPI00224B4302|nr:plastocyanin/azurin family copper-binding protein [Haladaptatus caseinilyticus]